MCQTFYLEHDKCTCIYVPAIFTPCAPYIFAHPGAVCDMSNPFADPSETSTEPDPFVDPSETPTEPNPFVDASETPTEPDPFADPEDPFADPVPKPNLIGQAPRPKLITKAFQGLNLTCNNIDFVSVELNDTRAPRGLYCVEGITARLVHSTGGEESVCSLCDKPDVLELVGGMRTRSGEWQVRGEEAGKGKGKGFFHRIKSAVGGRANKSESGLGDDGAAVGGGEGSKGKGKEKKEKKEKKSRDPTKSMYMDKWGGYIPPYC